MKTYTQTNANCFITALGCILDENPEALIEELGYTGLEIAWPDRPKPFCYRGHHIAEAIDLCLNRGYGLVPIHANAALGTKDSFVEVYKNSVDRLSYHIQKRRALMESATKQHAYAWDGKRVWDPNGKWLAFEDVDIKTAWILIKCLKD